ncbi:unnamed protein product [Sphenostylis stenocarpa]|uniref:GIR1-like zinc ribbon domain-containing protein n=1 Tax=Sphenostylis stenocarpa TaxID=92480 RepID=A0AA86RLF6_9FABA|nr:unnamed protein product [Sphenostylis stenocarpa]
MESPDHLAPDSPTSCVSIEVNQEDDNNNNVEHSDTHEVNLVVVGCPHCLMYVMVSEDDIKCPKCKSTSLIHFSSDNNPTIKKE